MNKELAKRAVASPHWRWMPGIWIVDEVGGRGVVLEVVQQVDQDYVKFQNPAHTRQGQVPAAWCVPDLSDPATLGCLLALVREAWGDPRAQLYAMEDADGREGWGLVLERGEGVGPFAETEAEALIAALEAAP